MHVGTHRSDGGRITATMSPAECHEACSSFALGKAEAGTGPGNRFGSVTDACTWRRVGERTSVRRRGRHSPELTPAWPSHYRGGLGVTATARHTCSHTHNAACPQATDHRSTPGAHGGSVLGNVNIACDNISDIDIALYWIVHIWNTVQIKDLTLNEGGLGYQEMMKQQVYVHVLTIGN
ncbi:hypothetical protein chiPu_0020065 [Chiloscyllium punctatum]|uniref:Uncharacterized protein n=1 Tax=Chiloscyllium punctatum TaxID=137246 RepID=A0A401RU07_CHIPU|nr:hypothetical protein [Chiloscyllium punctatum]